MNVILYTLTERERIIVAEESAIVGFTVLYCYSNIENMSHVGGVGTFILPSMRGKE